MAPSDSKLSDKAPAADGIDDDHKRTSPRQFVLLNKRPIPEAFAIGPAISNTFPTPENSPTCRAFSQTSPTSKISSTVSKQSRSHAEPRSTHRRTDGGNGKYLYVVDPIDIMTGLGYYYIHMIPSVYTKHHPGITGPIYLDMQRSWFQAILDEGLTGIYLHTRATAYLFDIGQYMEEAFPEHHDVSEAYKSLQREAQDINNLRKLRSYFVDLTRALWEGWSAIQFQSEFTVSDEADEEARLILPYLFAPIVHSSNGPSLHATKVHASIGPFPSSSPLASLSRTPILHTYDPSSRLAYIRDEYLRTHSRRVSEELTGPSALADPDFFIWEGFRIFGDDAIR